MNIGNQPRPKKRRGLLFYTALFGIGAVGYYLLEILFRGFSHWTMALCGGICLCLIYTANRRLVTYPLIPRALLGAVIITSVELVAGCVLNLYLQWGIWDYSHLPFNLWGQITPIFSGLWFALCLPICAICSFVDGYPLLRPRRVKKP